jgi:hypothetical protein
VLSDTLLAYGGVYDSVADAEAEADYQLVKDLAGTPAWSTRMTPPSSSVASEARPKSSRNTIPRRARAMFRVAESGSRPV